MDAARGKRVTGDGVVDLAHGDGCVITRCRAGFDERSVARCYPAYAGTGQTVGLGHGSCSDGVLIPE